MPNRRRVLAGLATTAATAVVSRQGWAAASIKIDDVSALLVIDVQNCFLPGGSLAVKDGEQVIPVINRIAKGFANVVMTQDWHTPGHISFASVHAGKKPFETVDLAYGKQVLWPDHCVQGTDGAALSKDLSVPQAALVIRKGFHKDVDSYSAFTEADGKTTTGLAAYLKARQIERLFVAGLATDFCVAWTALDARKAGFETYVVEDACRGIDTQGSLAKAWADMDKAGVKRIQVRRYRALALFVGAGFRSALGHRNQSRPQHAIADHVAGLHHLDHRTGGHRGVGHLVHRLLKIRIEFLARGIEFLHPVFLQRVEQRPLGQLDAFDQRLQTWVGRFLGLGRNRIERALQIVGDIENVARKTGNAVGAGVRHLAGGALAQVFHFGQRPQHLVARFRGLLGQRLDRALLGIVGHDIGLGY